MRVRARWIILAAAVASLGGAAAWELRRERAAFAASRGAAGPILLERLRTDVAPEVLFPPQTGRENAAPYYISALNDYNARRIPFLKNRKLNPFANEPAISPAELAALKRGAAQKELRLYQDDWADPALVFRIYPGAKAWPFRIATDPFELRPYVPVMRLFAQSALNEGKRLERLHQVPRAEAAYQSVARLGEHLQGRPGSFMDIQLGIEIEFKAMHYLDILYRGTKNHARLTACWRYGDSLNRLQTAVRRKYAQLDSLAAACEIASHDAEPVWRIEAMAALKTSLHFHELNWVERSCVAQAVESAQSSGSVALRQAALTMEHIPASEFRYPEPERKQRVAVKHDAGM